MTDELFVTVSELFKPNCNPSEVLPVVNNGNFIPNVAAFLNEI